MATSAPSDPTTAQVMMTLAAIAATAAVPRPSGEIQEEQILRARSGITERLRGLSRVRGRASSAGAARRAAGDSRRVTGDARAPATSCPPALSVDAMARLS
ncbi:hypothetical protein ABZZ79_07625 [Streptomyces sp. NPDC006458]|uniref:hypothetical protein n=1 Tax=Streptomyces sp. NPDC006458 TaxID=3154302 RepID=UPI0033B3C637